MGIKIISPTWNVLFVILWLDYLSQDFFTTSKTFKNYTDNVVYFQLRQEKVELEQTLEQEQECLVNKLMRKIEKLETETAAKQNDLETLRREKVCPL